VIATSGTSPDLPMLQDPMPLINGYYVMYPQEHHDELSKEFANLTVTKWLSYAQRRRI
jgi:hypothetical protein